MAKSLRSKWRRKCRAVKRVRYGEKELAQLKKRLGLDEDSKPITDIDMTNFSTIATVVKAEDIVAAAEAKQNTTSVEPTETVEVMDDDTVKRVYNPKTMRDQFGNYPVWMNKRRLIKRTKKEQKKKLKEKKKKGKKSKK